MFEKSFYLQSLVIYLKFTLGNFISTILMYVCLNRNIFKWRVLQPQINFIISFTKSINYCITRIFSFVLKLI